MVKAIATVLTIIVLSVTGVSAAPVSDNSTGFDLVEYIATHEIQSLEEFQEVIETNTDYTAPEYNTEEISYFDICIDYESYTVCVQSRSPATQLTQTLVPILVWVHLC